MLLIAGLLVTAALRAHHCRGVIGFCGGSDTLSIAQARNDAGPRVHSVLSDRTDGGAGSCSHGCSGHRDALSASTSIDPAPSDQTPSDQTPPHEPRDAPSHSHLGCIDSTTPAQVVSKDLVHAAPIRFASTNPVIDAPLSSARHWLPRVERRSGSPPPGLRSTRIRV